MPGARKRGHEDNDGSRKMLEVAKDFESRLNAAGGRHCHVPSDPRTMVQHLQYQNPSIESRIQRAATRQSAADKRGWLKEPATSNSTP